MSGTPAPLYGLLLSGGASQRMRQDKAALDYRGEPQLLRAWRLLQAVTEQAFVSVREHQRGDALRATLPQIVDSYEAVGPVAGILSAQERHPDAAWLVLACDLPLLDNDTLRGLIDARDPQAFATVFASSHDGLPEPLCAIWEPRSHALLRQRYEDGSFCPRKALMQSNIVLLPAPGDALDNVNTPEERQAMQQRLESLA
ncbi:NTP transferase domain-containing protein [Dyella japonica]|uniref:Bifunctional molybdenum cofactor biosynthesis protein (Molybdopterin-guanine dinucleotide biosynthesis protein A and MoaD) n=1 Tax=Dyella japonica DSM 16301 TaxID=1440762 RepID=A0A0G9H790_9GAMM|nr:NTP transferase domain-containing protein [Dyella japonica]KLD65331.1 bifunctional molybdenum cofactor biosynthesis protein (molybdopterin-guanine dinucleotide biosynthesis protein A and MoaD) [Dyella japonica DSM 16301]